MTATCLCFGCFLSRVGSVRMQSVFEEIEVPRLYTNTWANNKQKVFISELLKWLNHAFCVESARKCRSHSILLHLRLRTAVYKRCHQARTSCCCCCSLCERGGPSSFFGYCKMELQLGERSSNSDYITVIIFDRDSAGKYCSHRIISRPRTMSVC